jgi:trimethylamine--corrinoid protein Co-methyltransferase
MYLHGGIKVFSKGEMHRIHCAALRVLEDVGVEMHLPEAQLKRLAQRGLRVDLDTKRVRLPAGPVLETIQQLSGAPVPEITEDGTARPAAPQRIPTRLTATIGAHHGFVYDVGQGRMRPATHQDMYDIIKVKRHLADTDVSSAGICPQDVPQEVASVHAAAVAVKYCRNPSAPDVNGLEDLPWVERVMQAAGVWRSSQHHVVAIYPISPLVLAGRGAELMAFQAGRGDLSWVLGMVIPGASSPATLVGQEVIVLAEEFGFSTVYRLLMDPPNDRYQPRSIGDDVCIMDMRRGAYVLSSPEVALLRLATQQMAGEFYKFPGRADHGIRFFPDAQEPGIQAAQEGALMAMADLCQGVYSFEAEVTCPVGILGTLGGNLSVCPEEAIIDHEMFQYLQRFVRGLNVSDEALALDLIKEVGPGGSFLATEHTARHYRREIWHPKLWHRGAWDGWTQSGRHTPLDLARERVAVYRQEELEPVLDDGRLRDVDRVVQEAEIALLGQATGIRVMGAAP